VIAGPGPEVLARVPGECIGVQPLQGGLTNRSFLVTSTAGRFVVRLGTAFDALLAIDRRGEIAAQRLAASAGIAPPIVVDDVASGLLVTRFVEGREWTPADFAKPGQIERLGERLRRLHALDVTGIPGLARLDPLVRAREYAGRIAAAAPDERASLEQLLAEAQRRQRESGAAARRATLVHSDLNGSNLVDGEALWLIDWEYSALADPLHDAACVLGYYPQAAPQAARLLDALRLEATPRELQAVVWLFRLLVYLWYRARRIAVAPSAADLAAEQGAARALVHNRNL